MFYLVEKDEKKNCASIFNDITECVSLISFRLYFLRFSKVWCMFDEVSSFRNKMLANFKQELIIKNCQWNCMYNIKYNTHFDDYIKRTRPSQMMIF